MGAQLARMELRSLFSRIVPMLESVEMAGDPDHITNHVRRWAQVSADSLQSARQLKA